jgi:hypothetical protein
VDHPVDEEPRRARHAAARRAPGVLLDTLGVDAVAELAVEVSEIDADRLGVLA